MRCVGLICLSRVLVLAMLFAVFVGLVFAIVVAFNSVVACISLCLLCVGLLLEVWVLVVVLIYCFVWADVC